MAALLGEVVAEAGVTAAAASGSRCVVEPPGLEVVGRPQAAAPAAGQPARERRAAQPRPAAVVHVRAAATVRRAPDRGASTRGRASPPPTGSGSSSATAPRTTTAEAAPASGLAIARWVVDLHGGSDQPRSTPGPARAAPASASSSPPGGRELSPPPHHREETRRGHVHPRPAVPGRHDVRPRLARGRPARRAAVCCSRASPSVSSPASRFRSPSPASRPSSCWWPSGGVVLFADAASVTGSPGPPLRPASASP